MPTKIFELNDDGEIVYTMDGPVPKHMQLGPDLASAMTGIQTRRQARYGETIVGADVLDEHGNVVDEVTIGVTHVVDGNRQSVTIDPGNPNLESIARRETYLREKLASIVNPDGSPKLDDAGRDIYRDERYRIHGELTMLAAAREYETFMQQRREEEAAVLAQQDAIAREIAARKFAEDKANAKLAEHLRRYGINSPLKAK